ncbi:hypothetical protein BST61_g1336 [Cercospora zeina]
MPIPRGSYLERLIRMMLSFTIGRTSKVRGEQQADPEIRQAKFTLTTEGRKESDKLFKNWRSKAGLRDVHVCGGLTDAQQIIMHPELSDILDLYAKDLDARHDQSLTHNDRQRLRRWGEDLLTEDRYRSPRIDKIEWTLDVIRELYPDDAVIIMEESKYLLKTVEGLLQAMPRHPPYTVINGDVVPEERDRRLVAFRSAKGFRVLVMARATGGIGLNLRMANYLIITAQWWNEAGIAQAIGRSDREGQDKTVFVYMLYTYCTVELYADLGPKPVNNIII